MSDYQFKHHIHTCCRGLPWLDTRCPPKLLYHCPSQVDRGGKQYSERFMGQDRDRERSLTNYLHSQTDSTWGN